MTVLQWNNDTSSYQATVNGDLIEVDGDSFAEAVQDLAKEYIKEEMDADTARDKAEDELLVAEGWLNTPMEGVSINGVLSDTEVERKEVEECRRMLTEQEARARAERGASVLDEYCYGWERVIDLKWFDVTASGRCIIGQLTDDTYTGMILDMGLSFDDNEDVTHGFEVEETADYPMQQAAWVALIRERRGEA